MAITTEITTRQVAADLPSGYTVPTTTINLGASPVEEKFTYDVATSGIANATPATGLTALLAAVKTYVDSTLIPNTFKLDSSKTVNGIIYIDKVKVINTRTSIYGTGTEKYRVHGTVKYT